MVEEVGLQTLFNPYVLKKWFSDGGTTAGHDTDKQNYNVGGTFWLFAGCWLLEHKLQPA